MIALATVLGEQLDMDRLLVGLKAQHDKITETGRPGSEKITDILFAVGRGISDIMDHRSRKEEK